MNKKKNSFLIHTQTYHELLNIMIEHIRISLEYFKKRNKNFIFFIFFLIF